MTATYPYEDRDEESGEEDELRAEENMLKARRYSYLREATEDATNYHMPEVPEKV